MQTTVSRCRPKQKLLTHDVDDGLVLTNHSEYWMGHRANTKRTMDSVLLDVLAEHTQAVALVDHRRDLHIDPSHP
jgi:hypothetical protein